MFTKYKLPLSLATILCVFPVAVVAQDERAKPVDSDVSQSVEGIASNPGMIEAEKRSSHTDDDRGEDAVDDRESASEKAPIAAGNSQSEERPRLDTLNLNDVISSVYQSYPIIIQARQQAELARGELTEAWGSFDTKLKLESLNEPTGFYENYRHSVGASRQTWSGGEVYSGYRIGRGSFQPWYRERETDKGGEFKFGYRQSLFQGRKIDPARLAIYQASLGQQAVEPSVLAAVLRISRDAAIQYWDWVEAGLILEAQEFLLQLAETRGKQYEAGVDAGKFPEIDLILNKQLIAERRAKLIESTQKFQAAGFKLSLFLRDSKGNPLVPEADLLPNGFPDVTPIAEPDLALELSRAIARRPENRVLELERKRLRNEYALASNQTEPVLDFIGEGSQDLGEDASSSDDKDQFLLVLGVQGELPVQRRKARGKMIALRAKLAQLEQKQRLLLNKIQVDLAVGFNELQRDAEVVEQAFKSLEAARDALDRYRFAFEKGKIDLIYLNLLEVKANETEIKFLSANKQWNVAFARLRASLGLDPLSVDLDALSASALSNNGVGVESD